eukprot:UN17965
MGTLWNDVPGYKDIIYGKYHNFKLPEIINYKMNNADVTLEDYMNTEKKYLP